MSTTMGPVLGFCGIEDGKWRVCAITVTTGKLPALTWKSGTKWNPVKAETLKKLNEFTVSLYRWEVGLTEKPQKITYRYGTESWEFHVPPADPTRLRIAYASCNGFSSLSVMKKVENQNDRWLNLAAQHKKDPYQLLLMGGDQVYADSIWEVTDKIQEWINKLKRFRLTTPFSEEMNKEAESFYFNLYRQRWSQEEMRDVLARIPTIMMWDDHDIFDGWGSYDKKMQECPVSQGIFAQAKEHFKMFQLKTADVQSGTLETSGFSCAFKIGKLAILVPDLRSERTADSILSDKSWSKIYSWMDANLAGCSHLFVATSIPVVYPSFNLMETILGIIPGRQEIEDDLRDHWTSKVHRAERTRLIHRLLAYSAEHKCRVTILSGDVHVGAVGEISSGLYTGQMYPDTIHQLISSGIVHPPPPGIALFFLKSTADNIEKIDTGITAQMAEFPSTSERFINARNWLSLTIDDKERLWAEWFAEGQATPYTKVITKIAAS